MITTEQIAVMSEAELDALPEGIIELDKSGTVLYYNAAQAKLAHRTKSSTMGLNFFREVAPCTAVKDFQGRFNDFVEQSGDRLEPFTFLFRFGWGQRRATITLIRRAKVTGDVIYIVVNMAAAD